MFLFNTLLIIGALLFCIWLERKIKDDDANYKKLDGAGRQKAAKKSYEMFMYINLFLAILEAIIIVVDSDQDSNIKLVLVLIVIALHSSIVFVLWYYEKNKIIKVLKNCSSEEEAARSLNMSLEELKNTKYIYKIK